MFFFHNMQYIFDDKENSPKGEFLLFRVLMGAPLGTSVKVSPARVPPSRPWTCQLGCLFGLLGDALGRLRQGLGGANLLGFLGGAFGHLHQGMVFMEAFKWMPPRVF